MNKGIKSDISNSQVGGDVAGGNISKPTFIFNNSVGEAITYISTLYEKYREEKEQNQQIGKKIEELCHYEDSIDKDIIGLDRKLENGGQSSLTDYAKRAKERFTKKLLKDEYYESAQTIYAHILSIIESNFSRFVYPAIKDRQDNSYVHLLIEQYIHKLIVLELGENVLKIYKTEIDGMIYFLTGNCHIKWD